MAYAVEQVLSKIGTAEYSGVDGLIRLVQETSGIDQNGERSSPVRHSWLGDITRTHALLD